MRPILFSLALLYPLGVVAIPSPATTECEPQATFCDDQQDCNQITTYGNFICTPGYSQADEACSITPQANGGGILAVFHNPYHTKARAPPDTHCRERRRASKLLSEFEVDSQRGLSDFGVKSRSKYQSMKVPGEIFAAAFLVV
ncbi:unnamed protein product [Diplocarpon coronariae]